VALGALAVHGCAAPAVEVLPAVGEGRLAARPGRPGFVVAAPEAASDRHAGEIATEIARRTGFGLVVAAPGGAAPPADEAYERRVLETAQGTLRFYAEIHGDARQRPCAGQIEIATVGVDRDQALRLRALAELVRDAHLRAQPEVSRLPVLVAPADEVTHGASEARRDGILRLPQQAMHIELPRCARRDFRETYTAILADFLFQAVLVPTGR
jgi:hypothetical protein